MKLLVAALVAAVLVGTCVGDVPVHCEYAQVLGKWTVAVSGQMDRDVVCKEARDVASTRTFEFKRPNIVVSDTGAEGTWTIIYAEGIEWRVDGQKWFSYFHWEGKKSVCDRFMADMGGYVHDDAPAPGVLPENWACFGGKQTEKTLVPTLWTPAPIDGGEVIEEATKAHREADLGAYHEVLAEVVNAAPETFGWEAQVLPEDDLDVIVESLRLQGPALPRRFRPTPLRSSPSDLADLPKAWDWANVDGKSYVGPTEDQGRCGSCWAFGTGGSMQDRIRVMSKNAKTTILSKQDWVSCGTNYAQGCEGGWGMLAAKQSYDHSIVSEECFPYKSGSGRTPKCSEKCEAETEKGNIAFDYNYVGGWYGAATEQSMMEDIKANGPVTTSIMVYPDFMNYKSGVYRHKKLPITAALGDDPVFHETNHLVVITGWGETEDGDKYWIGRNSWGTRFGMDGYFWIARGENECAFESMPVSIIPQV